MPDLAYAISGATRANGRLTELIVSKFGTKYTCWSCGAKFYDLNKPEPKCPKCGEDPKDAPQARTSPAYDDDEEDLGDFDMPDNDEEE